VIRALAIIGAAALAMPAMAGDLVLPSGARLLGERSSPMARYALPLGPAADDRVPAEYFEGQVLRRTWRLAGDATTLQLFAPMRQQLQAAGFDILYQCQAQECGGFDFRFGIEVVPAPDMIVDIGDYLFLSALKGESLAVSLLVSRSGSSAYIQVIEVGPPNGELIAISPIATPDPEVQPTQERQDNRGDLVKAMSSTGRVVLADLEFETGSARLGAGPFDSLAQLALALADSPEMRVMLVGHTDNVGTQDDNVALSQRRAEAVRERLLTLIEADVTRIEVFGAGFMAPLTSNLTREGRDANRRVEAVMMSR